RVVHCMALDERRLFFPLTRLGLTGTSEQTRLSEVWFRGVHSDVGGGDTAIGLSSIALNFMLKNALRAGLPIDPAAVTQNAARMDANCAICVHPEHDFERLAPFRGFRVGDLVHVSVAPRIDGDGRSYNNPPATLARVDDDCATVSVLTAGAAART